jgi:hypothetical protein
LVESTCGWPNNTFAQLLHWTLLLLDFPDRYAFEQAFGWDTHPDAALSLGSKQGLAVLLRV